jgi:hypothetical protein
MPDTPDYPEDSARDADPLPSRAPVQPALDDLRRRVDDFWQNPRIGELRQRIGSGLGEDQQRALAPSDVLQARSSETLGSRFDQMAFRLQKSLTYRDGQLVSISGDDRPLAPDDQILVVTTTTTVMDSDSVAVETDLLLFEREE